MASGPATTFSPIGGKKAKRLPFLIGGVLVAVIVAAAIVSVLLVNSRQNAVDAHRQPEEALAYASQLGFSGLHLSAEVNFLGQQVVYLDGQIANAGPKVVRQLGVRLFFRDILNQVVLREEHEVIGGAQSVGPGQTRAFQIRFDQVPDSWTRQVPELQIIALRVQQP